MKDYISLVLNNLRRRKLRSYLTVLGIVIGITAIVALISLGDALQSAVLGQFSTLSTDKLTIQNSGTGFGPPGSTAVRKLTSHDLKIIEKVQYVQATVPRLIRVAGVEYNGIRKFEYVSDILNDDKQNKIIYDSLNVKPQSGRLLNANDRGKVILGNDFTDETTFEKKIKVGSRLTIQGKEFEVVGILEKSSSFQVNFVILMNEDDMKKILNIGDEIDLIVAQIDDPSRTEIAAEKIILALRRDRNEKLSEEDFSVQTPVQALSTVNTILTLIQIIITSIAAISLLIGGIGVMNTMYTSVLERKREIGTMKAVGARNQDVLWIFLLESALLGVIGGIIGTIIGLALAFGVVMIAKQFIGTLDLKVGFSIPLILGAIAFSSVVGIASGVLPAFQASKLKPVDALRS